MGFVFFFKQKTAYEMRISDWSSDVCSSDRLPPTIADVLRPRTGAISRLAEMKDGRRDECLRLAVRHLRGKVGFPLVLGDVRRSFSAHLYERCRDTALTQLIAADTLGQSDGPLHYYAPREGEVDRKSPSLNSMH